MTDTLLEAIREVLNSHGEIVTSSREDYLTSLLRQCMERMEADSKDAVRYRFLRDQVKDDSTDWCVYRLSSGWSPDLDGFIDSAILNNREQKA